MSQSGDKKDKKSSSGKDKDNKLLDDMAKDPNREVVELVNNLDVELYRRLKNYG